MNEEQLRVEVTRLQALLTFVDRKQLNREKFSVPSARAHSSKARGPAAPYRFRPCANKFKEAVQVNALGGGIPSVAKQLVLDAIEHVIEPLEPGRQDCDYVNVLSRSVIPRANVIELIEMATVEGNAGDVARWNTLVDGLCAGDQRMYEKSMRAESRAARRRANAQWRAQSRVVRRWLPDGVEHVTKGAFPPNPLANGQATACDAARPCADGGICVNGVCLSPEWEVAMRADGARPGDVLRGVELPDAPGATDSAFVLQTAGPQVVVPWADVETRTYLRTCPPFVPPDADPAHRPFGEERSKLGYWYDPKRGTCYRCERERAAPA